MPGLFARLILAVALIVQGVGALASEIPGTASHPHCHQSGTHGKQIKMPCCHCDECNVPACSSGCAVSSSAFIVPSTLIAAVHPICPELHWTLASTMHSIDSSPPIRPPII
jgi:hypothetical protein